MLRHVWLICLNLSFSLPNSKLRMYMTLHTLWCQKSAHAIVFSIRSKAGSSTSQNFNQTLVCNQTFWLWQSSSRTLSIQMIHGLMNIEQQCLGPILLYIILWTKLHKWLSKWPRKSQPSGIAFLLAKKVMFDFLIWSEKVTHFKMYKKGFWVTTRYKCIYNLISILKDIYILKGFGYM